MKVRDQILKYEKACGEGYYQARTYKLGKKEVCLCEQIIGTASATLAACVAQMASSIWQRTPVPDESLWIDHYVDESHNERFDLLEFIPPR